MIGLDALAKLFVICRKTAGRKVHKVRAGRADSQAQTAVSGCWRSEPEGYPEHRKNAVMSHRVFLIGHAIHAVSCCVSRSDSPQTLPLSVMS